MQAYVPTFLTIFISWVSFSLGPKAIPARTMLGVNALLVTFYKSFWVFLLHSSVCWMR